MATGFASEDAEAVVAEADAELLAAAGIESDPSDGPVEERVIDLDRQAEIVDEILARDGHRLPEIEEPAETAINDTRDEELDCLAKVISNEARGEPRSGQLAVAQVVMNRVESPLFPNSICGVVYQRAQFSNIRGHHPRRSGAQWERFVEIAIDARNGISQPVVGEALFFHANYVRPAFARRKTRLGQVGAHIFYR
ncbi:MAG: cell wall hydrolase [Parasphingopyxis sp.]|nr:cell wall hydrolase [Sphingomonadales bacterium]